MRILIALCASALLASNAHAGLFLNEVLASTSGADSEFIEIYNSGPDEVDLAGYTIDEIESDADNSGLGDVDDTFAIPSDTPTLLPAGGFYLIGNATFESTYGITSDLTLPLSIENSSSTLVLKDSMGVQQYAVLLNDGDGVAQTTVDLSFGPDGTFLPAGYFLDTDGGSTASLLEFGQPSPSATPGASNNPIPEPGTIALVMLGLAAAGATSMRKRLG